MFARVSPLKYLENFARFKLKATKKTGGGLNFHRSNRAKEGLYHGKDIRSGHSISFSHTRSKRKFRPNVINKRVFSSCLDQYIRFRMTTAALKEIDHYGGVDKYMLELDEKSVADSKHNTRIRDLIASTLFYKGKLDEKYVKKLGYSKQPPMKPEEIIDLKFKPVPYSEKRPNRAPLTPIFKHTGVQSVSN